MSEIYEFEVFANNGRGLLGRLVLPDPDDTPAVAADIDSISYAVYDLTADGLPAEGVLSLDDNFSDILLPWKRDKIGYNFHWAAPGSLWALAGHRYRIVVTFPLKVAVGDPVITLLLVWEASTISPSE